MFSYFSKLASLMTDTHTIPNHTGKASTTTL